jgi:alkyl sulfatase BDS1-like metallo-beta-lactamase superfamily hydrolase
VSAVDLIHTLRVLLDPARAEGLRAHVRFVVDGESAGLLLRNCVAVPTDGTGASVEVAMTRATLVGILSTKQLWSAADVTVTGDSSVVDAFRKCFDHAGLQG